jgi:AcrR family transcriptional regulator
MYHHYESKRALLGELAVSGFMELGRELERADREAAAGRRLRGWATAYFRFAQREPALFGLMFDPEIAELPAVVEARRAALAALRRIVGEVAAGQGSADPPLDQIAQAVWAAAHGAASLAISAPGRAGLIDEVISGLEALFRPGQP